MRLHEPRPPRRQERGMSMEEIKLDTIHNTVLRCRLVFFDIWH